MTWKAAGAWLRHTETRGEANPGSSTYFHSGVHVQPAGLTQCWVKMYITMTMTQSTPGKAEATEPLAGEADRLRARDGCAAGGEQRPACQPSISQLLLGSHREAQLFPFQLSVLGAFLSSALCDVTDS